MTTRIAAILFLCSLLPVHQSVLAPAEVVSESPSYLRAPFEGVVDAIHISPGNAVHKGDVLASLDTKQLQAKYDVALRSLDIARAEYTEASQQALSDGKAKSHLPLLQSKIDQQEAEKAYLTSLLDHATLIAPSDGVAVFDDAYNLVGKPVVVGERIMVIASPQNTSLEIQVPATGMTAFTDDAPVDFFSNIEPSHAIHAHLTYTSYASALTAEGVLSYRLIAHLEEGQPSLRLGLKGTAKVYGHDRPLIMWLLRRPFALVRQWIFL